MKDHFGVDIEPGDKIFYVSQQRFRGGGRMATVRKTVKQIYGGEYITVRTEKDKNHPYGYTAALFGKVRSDILIIEKFKKD